MTQNVGGIDRVARLLVGAAIVGFGIYFKSWWGIVGLVPILTGAIGWCPAYLPFGISTCRTKTQ